MKARRSFMKNEEKRGLTVPQGNGITVFEKDNSNAMKSVQQVCRQYGITKKTLFYYDKKGILKPSCRAGKQSSKMYDKKTIERLEMIMYYKKAGLLLSEIRVILDGPEGRIEEIMETDICRLIKQEKELAEKLKRARALAKAMKEKK
jgi:DNA-binding transcriptional MerR regulator